MSQVLREDKIAIDESVAISSHNNTIKVLVVEDDLDLQEAIFDTLDMADYDVLTASSGEQALDVLSQHSLNMVISDVNMQGMDGHELLVKIKHQYPSLPVLLMTAYASIQRSVEAMRAGAVDYLVKPFQPKALIKLVQRHTVGLGEGDKEPIVRSPLSRELLAMAQRVAGTDSTVLITGDSGTGKEVLARYIHSKSARKAKPFIAINCAAIPETMLEATLFGHEKGAFTGAHQASQGKFEQANGGTLLLDEISEMDIGLQAKILRVIQEREVEKVGGKTTIPLDVRILATTNRNLRSYVDEGKFREDLYYRLSVFPLRWPALRERPEDIVPIAEHLLRVHAAKMARPIVGFSSAALKKLESYAWPGNVRELDNIVQRALILQMNDTIDVIDLLFDAEMDSGSKADYAVSDDDQAQQGKPALGEDLRQHEYQIILDTLKALGGSKKDTAEKLGISARTLRYKMAKMREEGVGLDT